MCRNHLKELASFYPEMLASDNSKYTDFVPTRGYIKNLCRRFGLKRKRLTSIREKTEPTSVEKADALDELVKYAHENGMFSRRN